MFKSGGFCPVQIWNQTKWNKAKCCRSNRYLLIKWNKERNAVTTVHYQHCIINITIKWKTFNAFFCICKILNGLFPKMTFFEETKPFLWFTFLCLHSTASTSITGVYMAVRHVHVGDDGEAPQIPHGAVIRRGVCHTAAVDWRRALSQRRSAKHNVTNERVVQNQEAKLSSWPSSRQPPGCQYGKGEVVSLQRTTLRS